MLKFEQLETKIWDVYNDDEKVHTLNLITSTITNKYFIVTSYLEKMSKVLGEEFDEWFINYLQESDEIEEKYNFLLDNVEKIKYFVNKYMDKSDLDFSKFVDESKAKKNSIFFKDNEIKRIIQLSSYLKLYSAISNSDSKLNQKLHTNIYNKLAEDIMNDNDIIFKLFNVIKTKTFRYNHTDSYMWEYIKLIQCKSVDVHVIEIFNFIMNSILILCEEDKNPITYFVSVVDESVKWFLRSVYKGSIIYDDSISTEDIHGMNINNLKSYCYNDTLGQLKKIAFDKLHYQIEEEPHKFDCIDSNEAITTFHNRTSRIENLSPMTECIIYPIISVITEIPYAHFKTLSPEHAAVLSAYMKNIFSQVFKGKYENIFTLLDYYPLEYPAIMTTYKIKGIHNFINLQDSVKNFYGFNTKIIAKDIISYFIGRIARVKFSNIYTGDILPNGIPLGKIEAEMVEFFTYLFSGKMRNEIEKMKELVLSDF